MRLDGFRFRGAANHCGRRGKARHKLKGQSRSVSNNDGLAAWDNERLA